jgi:signal transduction histidine kinase
MWSYVINALMCTNNCSFRNVLIAAVICVTLIFGVHRLPESPILDVAMRWYKMLFGKLTQLVVAINTDCCGDQCNG